LAEQNQVASADRLLSKWQRVLSCVDERRATPLKALRYVFPIVCGESSCGRDDFALYVLKSVPQRLKAVERQTIYGTAEAVPFV
jgi:hypothetical protein